MKNGFIIVIWFLVFALSVFLLLVIPKEFSPAMWVTLGFDIFAFVSQLIVWLVLISKSKDSKGVFYSYPVMAVSGIYLVLQFIICLATAFIGGILPIKAVLIANFILLVIMWCLILGGLAPRGHIEKLDSRQKDNHKEL